MKHLRALVLARGIEDKWSHYLPLVQRILNFTPDSSIGTAPAKLIFGSILSDVGFDVLAMNTEVAVSEYLGKLQETQLELIRVSREHLEGQARQRDARLPLEYTVDFQVGDYVLLAYPSRPPNKLSAMYRGPLRIVSRERSDLYELLDLVSNKLLKVHLSRLRKLHLDDSTTIEDILRIAGIDQGEFVVSEILDHRWVGSRNKRQLEFLVRWENYEPGDDTWEPLDNLKDVAALDAYSQAHPELKLG
jgi:hypothetical protein